ncbi:MAG TPA: hypothetical protein PLU49_03655 [Saprospiraceae bacterium]|nr:hypothetical protein [Saprospiraceae bacterium]
MRKLSVILIFVALNIFTSFQQAVLAQEKSSGDTQFELGAYRLAIDSYLQELKQYPDNAAILEKLATSYALTNQSVRAARMYDQMMQSGKPVKPEHLIAYGHILRSMGLFDQAKSIYEKCEDPAYLAKAQHFAKMSGTASQMMGQRDAFEVSLVRPSSKSDDFGPTFWKDDLVFSSFTNDQAETNPLNFKRNKLNLIQSRNVKNAMVSAEMKSGNIDWQGVHSLHFSSDLSKVVFTRNNFRNGNKQIIGNEKNLSIYIADVDKNGVFSNETALPVNHTNHSVAFACFGEDVNTVYFSSNMHGDQTDFDLYVIHFEQNAWSTPQSLGSNINTPGNEISPYYVNGVLYFSSDFHPGLGGFDVFTSTKMNDVWALPENLGKGINSLGDDITLVFDPERSEYFYASNRIGGKGGYDLYYSVPSQRNSEDEMLAQSLPKSVSLESLIDPNSVNMKTSPSEQVGFRDNVLAPDDLSLEGAVRVAYGEIINTTMRVYFVQLASITQDKGNYDRYNGLIELGNVYRIKKDNAFKIRLGYFYGEAEAKEVLSTVRSKGFKDAFLVEEMLNVKELELLVSRYSFQKNAKYEKPAVESSYKVRLAAYSNPLYFDVEKVKDLGMIEQWSKDKWTIFILSGFETIEQAKNSQIKAINRGFTGAELVLDSDGVLTRVNEN